MAVATTPEISRKIFLLEQPFCLADTAKPEERWELAVHEGEPEIRGLEAAHRLDPEEATRRTAASWRRIERARMVELAVSEEPEFRRVGVVCGAGLGKTTTLQYLEAAISGLDGGRNKNFAVFLELGDLPRNRSHLLDSIVEKITNRVAANEGAIRHAMERLLSSARVTFLLDSLDQADAALALPALRELLQGAWGGNRVWVSGRPYAFRAARPKLEEMTGSLPWQFIRIGQLDLPECKYLLEAAKPQHVS